MAKVEKQAAEHETVISAEQAMNRVLEAESQAQQAIAEYIKQSEEQLRQAREQAHRIKMRTNNRITLLHQRCSRLITDEISQIQQGNKQETINRKTKVEDQIIDVVAEKIAEELTTL